jgi:HSP20 family molecular chaperone IbpA
MKPEIKKTVLLRISMQLPNLRPGAVDISTEGCVVRIASHQEDGCGPFESLVEIPEGFDVARGNAFYYKDVLRLDFPKLLIKQLKKHSLPKSKRGRKRPPPLRE